MKESLLVALPSIGVLALVVMQGGFYAQAACAVGILIALAAVLFAISGGALLSLDKEALIDSLLLGGVGACGLISAALNGATLSMVAVAMRWFGVAAFALLIGLVCDGRRAECLRIFRYLGLVSAAVALAMYVVSLASGSETMRLQSFFQYANASGIWFAVIALLCLTCEDVRIRRASALPVLALLLTQSVGAIGVFVLALLACFLLGQKEGDHGKGSLLIALLGGAVLAFVAVAISTGRLSEARQTFIERLIQISDASTLLASHPFGVGPDAWSYLYPRVQTAQYTAASVHCSYLQIGLDSGFPGLALFVIWVLLGIIGIVRSADALGRREHMGVLAAYILLLVHALFDFDFSFDALVLLLVILRGDRGVISENGAEEAKASAVGASAINAWTVVSGLACALACAIGLSAALIVSKAYRAGLAGDIQTIADMRASSSLAERDVSVRTSWCAALLQTGDTERTLAFIADTPGVETPNQALLCAATLFRAGKTQAASGVLVSELEAEPYDTELYEQSATLFARYGIDASLAGRYREAVERANRLAHEGNAALLDSQEALDVAG